jgi:mannose-6-phosphate isomerase-like protein (cupin superfamily)
MQFWLDRADAVPEVLPDGKVAIHPLFDDARGCRKFVQRLLVLRPGSTGERVQPDEDEVLYVLSGTGTLDAGEARTPLAEGTAVFLAAGTPWSVEGGEELEIVSVLVRDPEPATVPHAFLDLAAERRQSATASRQFSLGSTPAVGCESVTQFIGYVPPGRAPDHFHRYDEVIYILEGQGALHIGGDEAPLYPGACVHLPATVVHSLANTGETEMALLGVFGPAGSPAEAYYPDGTPAAYPEE